VSALLSTLLLAVLAAAQPSAGPVPRPPAVPSAAFGPSAQQGQRPGSRFVAGQRIDEQELQGAPSARDVWALLEHEIPVVVSQRLDVGGSATGTQGLYSARATTWMENVYLLDGFDVTDPAVRGASAFYYDWDAFRSVSASWGTQPAGVASGGVVLDMALQRGGSAWHGAAQGYFSFDALQAGNLSDELAAQGVPPASQIDYLSDASLQIGGPLSEAASIFGSYRDRRISQVVPGFDAPVTTSLPPFTVKLDARWGSGASSGGSAGVGNATDDLGLLLSRQDYSNPARDAAPLTAPEATLTEDSTAMLFGARWGHDFAVGALRRLEVRGSWLDIDLPLALQPAATRQSQFDIVTRVRSGSAPLQIQSSRRRYAGEGLLDLDLQTGSVRHAAAAGVQLGYAPTETSYSAIDDVNIFTSNGGALAAQLLDTPVDSRADVRSLGLWLHDDIGFADRWALSFGLRYDDWSGSLPSQSSPAGTYAPARQYGARSGVIGWWALSPRAAVTFDIRGDGELLITASYAQYAHQLGASTVGYGNPNAPGATTVSWTDLNGDGQFQPGEGGPVSTVATGTVRSIDDSLSTPLTREVRAGIGMALGSDWRARADFWYRKDDHLFDDVEVGLQASDFAEEVVLDPGPDNVVGTDDDAGLRVFNQIDGFGDNARLLTTVDGKTGTYRGLDLALERPWADGWTLRTVLTVAYAEGASDKSGLVPGDTGGISDLYDDPNTLSNAGIYGSARLFWDRPWVLKVYGAYELPRGIVLAGVLRSWAGAPIGRIVPVALNQGIVNVWAEPRGAAREPALTTGDLRVAKDFDVARTLRLSLYGDLFNVTNAGTVVRSYQVFPLYGVPAEIVAPFIARIGARVTF